MIFERSADAYGNALIFTAPDTTGNWWDDAAVQSDYGANEFTYCGYRFDPETQLYYVRNRTYNPVLGRWIQRDPIGYAGGINLYEYVDGSPIEFVDPNGECPAGYRAFPVAVIVAWEAAHVAKAIHEWIDPSLKKRVPASALNTDTLLQGLLIPPSCPPKCRQVGYCVRTGPSTAVGKRHVISRGKWHFLYTTQTKITIGHSTTMVPDQNVCKRQVKYWRHTQQRGDFLVEYGCVGYGISNSGRPQPGTPYTVDVYYGSVVWLTSGKVHGTYEQTRAFDINPFFGAGVGVCE